MLSRLFLVGERFKDGELLENISSFTGVSTSLGTTGPFPLSQRSVAHCGRYLVLPCDCFRSRAVAGRSCAVSTWPNLGTLSSVLLIPLAFSPCPDTN